MTPDSSQKQAAGPVVLNNSTTRIPIGLLARLGVGFITAVVMFVAKERLPYPLEFRLAAGLVGIPALTLGIRRYQAYFKGSRDGWHVRIWVVLMVIALFVGFVEAVLDVFKINL